MALRSAQCELANSARVEPFKFLADLHLKIRREAQDKVLLEKEARRLRGKQVGKERAHQLGGPLTVKLRNEDDGIEVLEDLSSVAAHQLLAQISVRVGGVGSALENVAKGPLWRRPVKTAAPD